MSTDLSLARLGGQSGDERLREHTLAELNRYIDQNQTPSGDYIEMAARVLDRHPKTIRRWLRDGRLPQRAAWIPDEAAIIDLYLGKNVATDARQHMKIRLGKKNVLSERTLQRGYATLSPWLRGYIEQGRKGFDENTLVLTDPDGPLPRNYRWEADFVDLKVRTLPRGYRRRLKAYLVVIIDCGTRVVMGWALVVGRRPNRSDVLQAVYDAVCTNDRCGPGYGAPVEFRCDLGPEFVAADTVAALTALAARVVPTRPYSPAHKGRVERVQGTLKRKIASQVGASVDGARDQRGNLYADDARGIELELLTEVVADCVATYNNETVHSALGGRTPAQAWADDPTPIREIPAEEAQAICQCRKTGKVLRQGIAFNNTWYVHDDLNEIKGAEIEYRFNQNNLDTIEVLRNGEWLCTAMDVRLLSPSAKREATQKRAARLREAGRLRAKAARERRVRLQARTGSNPNPADTQFNEINAAAPARRRKEKATVVLLPGSDQAEARLSAHLEKTA